MALPARSDFLPYVRDEVYSDFVVDFSKNPVTGYLGEVVNETAVAQMLQCLVLTEQGAWPFEPFNGSTVSHSLFEPNDSFSSSTMVDSIQNAIRNYAPQVSIVAIQLPTPFENPAGEFVFGGEASFTGIGALDTVTINLFFQIQNIPGTFNTVISVLRRIR